MNYQRCTVLTNDTDLRQLGGRILPSVKSEVFSFHLQGKLDWTLSSTWQLRLIDLTLGKGYLISRVWHNDEAEYITSCQMVVVREVGNSVPASGLPLSSHQHLPQSMSARMLPFHLSTSRNKFTNLKCFSNLLFPVNLSAIVFYKTTVN